MEGVRWTTALPLTSYGMESKAGNTRDVPNTIPGILIYTVRFGEVPGRQEPTHSVYRHQHRAEAPLRNERIATTFSPDTTVAAVGRDWFVMTGRGDLYKNDEKFLAKNLEIPRPAFTVDQTSGDWYAVQWKGTHNDALRGLDGHALDAAPEVIGQNFTAGTRIAAAFGNWFVTTAKGTIVCVCGWAGRGGSSAAATSSLLGDTRTQVRTSMPAGREDP